MQAIFKTEEFQKKKSKINSHLDTSNQGHKKPIKQFSSINHSIPLHGENLEKFIKHSKKKTINNKEVSTKIKLEMVFNKDKKQKNRSEKNIYSNSKKKDLTQITKSKRDSEIFSSHALNQIKRRADVGYLEHRKLQRQSNNKVDLEVVLSLKESKQKELKGSIHKKFKNLSKIDNIPYSDSFDTFFKVFKKNKKKINNHNNKRNGTKTHHITPQKKGFFKRKIQIKKKTDPKIQQILSECCDMKEPYLLKHKNYSNKELQNSNYDNFDCIYEPNVYKSQPHKNFPKHKNQFKQDQTEYIRIYKQDSLNVSSEEDFIDTNDIISVSPDDNNISNINESYNFQQLYQQSSNIYSDQEDSKISKSASPERAIHHPSKKSKTSKLIDQYQIQKSEIYKSEIMNKQNYSKPKHSTRKSQIGVPLKMPEIKNKKSIKVYHTDKTKPHSIKPSSRSNHLVIFRR